MAITITAFALLPCQSLFLAIAGPGVVFRGHQNWQSISAW
uniref:Uncharacterized protein n=1 Tax=uncultured bacterium B19D1_C12D4_E9D6 TaxID=1329637 RepID=S4W910_9BACT|nr:hypothetical protein [uncultured bacterium B19D1_C12D4_E9D6]